MPKTKTPATQSTDKAGKAIEKVIEIIQFMGDNHLAELELETSDIKMKLKKHASTISVPAIPNVAAPIPVSMPAPVKFSQAVKVAKEPEKQEKAAEDENFHKINSPMAGTFYRAPSPTSSPFVNEGDTVTQGQTVCIVEAMKMMNEIKADKAGKVVKIHKENGKPVEKGDVLFYIGE